MAVTNRSGGLAVEGSAVTPTEPIWRLRVDQYHAMIDAGILTEDDPVELLEGWLVVKMPKSPAHRLVTGLIRQALEQLAPAGWYVDTQEPITLEDSEPEPDVVVVRGQRRDYTDRHPGPQDVALVVEVADATVQRDRIFKKQLYARSGILIYWIVDLQESRFEVYADPSGQVDQPDYRRRHDYGASDALPVVIDGVEVSRITVRELLP